MVCGQSGNNCHRNIHTCAILWTIHMCMVVYLPLSSISYWAVVLSVACMATYHMNVLLIQQIWQVDKYLFGEKKDFVIYATSFIGKVHNLYIYGFSI